MNQENRYEVNVYQDRIGRKRGANGVEFDQVGGGVGGQYSENKKPNQEGVPPQQKMAPFGSNMPELFFKDNNQMDSVERYNVVYRPQQA